MKKECTSPSTDARITAGSIFAAKLKGLRKKRFKQKRLLFKGIEKYLERNLCSINTTFRITQYSHLSQVISE